MKDEVMNLEESKEVYGRVWREERKGENDVIIISKIKETFLESF